jgi:phospholipase/lecithinase/hemolysin
MSNFNPLTICSVSAMQLVKTIFTFNPQNLYIIGARRIGVTSLPPLGCLPASITLFGGGSNNCVERLNNDAVTFNKKVGDAAKALKNKHSDLKLVVFDIYNPLLDLIKNPANSGMCQFLFYSTSHYQHQLSTVLATITVFVFYYIYSFNLFPYCF